MDADRPHQYFSEMQRRKIRIPKGTAFVLEENMYYEVSEGGVGGYSSFQGLAVGVWQSMAQPAYLSHRQALMVIQEAP